MMYTGIITDTPTKESCVVQTTPLAYSLGGAEALYNNHDSQGLQLLFL